MLTAAAAKIRTAVVDGAEHTDSSLAEMKTGDIAVLIAAIRGGNPPKPATKAKAIELFWAAAETLPQEPEATPKTPKKRNAKAKSSEAKTETQGAEETPSAKSRKAKLYSIADGATVEGLTPQARELVQAMQAAGKPLTMAECAALLQVRKKSRGPERVVAWYFSRIFRPAGILVESRDGRSA